MSTGTARRKRIVGRALAHLVADGDVRARCGQASGAWIDAHEGDENCSNCTILASGAFTPPSRRTGTGITFTPMPLADAHRELLLALSLSGDAGLRLTNHDPAEMKWLRASRSAVQFAPATGGALRWKLTARGAEALRYNRYLEG